MEQWTGYELVECLCSGNHDGRIHTLDRGQAELLGHIGVLNLAGFIEGHAADQLGQVAGGGDGGATAEGLEDDIIDLAGVLVHADLKLHDIATGGGADEAGTDVLVALLEGADVAGVVVVVQNLLVVSSALSRSRGWDTAGGLDGLQAGEGSEGARRHSADAGSDGDKTLEHC